MSSSVSIGDQARIASLRQANHLLKSRLTTLTQEATTGLKADVAASLGGNLGRLAQVETRLTQLEAYQQNTAQAEGEFSGVQDVLGAVQTMASTLGPALQAAVSMGDETSMNLRSTHAADDFRAAVNVLNTDVGGRFILSGSNVETSPLSSSVDILADAKDQLAGATTAADKIAAISAWFDAPAGVAGFLDTHYHGNTETVTTGLSARSTIGNDTNASDAGVRRILKGLALAALANDPDVALDKSGKALMMGEAVKNLNTGAESVIMLRAAVGLKQEAVEHAATTNAAERTSLSIARSDILSVDPYETASAITQTEANLQNLYALTARLSRLSLTDYLR